MDRRRFLKQVGIGGTLAACARLRAAPADERPNIVFITTDQQSATMMSCAGNRWLQTPAMDYLAANGTRFERAYAANPVCSPARVSWMTGRLPGYFDTPERRVRENGASMRIKGVTDEVHHTTIGAYLKGAGYDLAYVGKTHLPRPLSPKQQGFTVLDGDARERGAAAAAAYIQQDHERPYFLWINFINPHDICFYAINDYRIDPGPNGLPKGRGGRANTLLRQCMTLPEGVSRKDFLATRCPPLPANHAPQEDEPIAVRELVRRRSFRKRARDTYSSGDWRLHRWAYHRLTELVDARIQVVLDALTSTGAEDTTVVIFTSDHGDHAGAHKMEHKSTLYEEAANVPLLVMHRGTAPAGRVDRTHLVSSGLDLLPTVCDYAGLPEAQADPRGLSLRPLIEGRETDVWRTTLGVEAEVGRMVVSGSLKYMRYDLAREQEQLVDLDRDPGELHHVTEHPRYRDDLERLRAAFDTDWFPVPPA